MSWLIDNIASYIEHAIIWCVNQIILSIGALIAAIVGALPNMPSFPVTSIPSGVLTWWDFGSYWFPVAFFLTLMTTLTVLWFGWLVLSIPLRWAKAIRGDE